MLWTMNILNQVLILLLTMCPLAHGTFYPFTRSSLFGPRYRLRQSRSSPAGLVQLQTPILGIPFVVPRIIMDMLGIRSGPFGYQSFANRFERYDRAPLATSSQYNNRYPYDQQQMNEAIVELLRAVASNIYSRADPVPRPPQPPPSRLTQQLLAQLPPQMIQQIAQELVQQLPPHLPQQHLPHQHLPQQHLQQQNLAHQHAPQHQFPHQHLPQQSQHLPHQLSYSQASQQPYMQLAPHQQPYQQPYRQPNNVYDRTYIPSAPPIQNQPQRFFDDGLDAAPSNFRPSQPLPSGI